jgi:hypothetical protein
VTDPFDHCGHEQDSEFGFMHDQSMRRSGGDPLTRPVTNRAHDALVAFSLISRPVLMSIVPLAESQQH